MRTVNSELSQDLECKLTSKEIQSYQKPYPIPERYKYLVATEIWRLLAEGIIRIAENTRHVSLEFPIIKKNGTVKYVVDYQELNKMTEKDNYLFQNIREELQAIPQSDIYTTIDLEQGYHQLEIEENSRKYTALVIPNGHFEYLRVPFGLANQPRFLSKSYTCYTREPTIYKSLFR